MTLHTDQRYGRIDAVSYCKQQHGANATLVRGIPAVMAAAQMLVKQAKLAPADGSNPWTAAAWTGITKQGSKWQDKAGVVATIPWCPNEPNNKGGDEACTSLLTGCSAAGTALVNDEKCERPLYPLCSVESKAC